jgi:hypothetical protein
VSISELEQASAQANCGQETLNGTREDDSCPAEPTKRSVCTIVNAPRSVLNEKCRTTARRSSRMVRRDILSHTMLVLYISPVGMGMSSSAP